MGSTRPPMLTLRPSRKSRANAPPFAYTLQRALPDTHEYSRERPVLPHANDAAILAPEESAPRSADVLPHGRLLRDLLRGREEGRQAAGHHPDGAWAVG